MSKLVTDHTKMLAALRRGWLLAAVFIGLVLQFFQFFRSQTIVLTVLSPSYKAADEGAPTALNVNTPQQGQQEDESRFVVDIRKALENNKAVEYFDLPDHGEYKKHMVSGSVKLPPRDQIRESKPEVFVPSEFNYSQPAIPTSFNLPPPNRTNQSTIILCLSARANFERRAAARDTWAKGNDNVYFVIGGPVPGDTEDMDREDALSTSSLLFQEQQRFGDIIDVIHPDSYKSLPFKLHAATTWMFNNLDNLEWVVKVDDDAIVRVRLLDFFVLRKMNPLHPQVIGTVNVAAKPHREGKWAEDPKFTADVYPPWAFGSAGYVFSRPIAEYLANHKELYYYQGEDAGLGIWLNESPLQVTWVDTPELRKDEGCLEKLYIIGHDLSIDSIYNCFGQVGDEVPDRKHVVAFAAGRKDQFPGRINNPNL
jgi:Galactosyltransferase